MKTSSHIAAAAGRRHAAALLVVVLLLVGPAGVPAAAAAPPPSCFAWDFTNSTGQDADGLAVAIRGVQQLTDVYAGDGNVFGAPASQGYDAAADAYRLQFAGGPALDGTQNHLGVCAGDMTLRLAQLGAEEPFAWMAGGKPAAPAPVFLGVSWERRANGALHVTLYNDQSRALTLWSAALLVAPAPLSLDDLNGETASTLGALADLGDDVIVLDPGSTRAFDIPAPALQEVPAGAALILDVEFSNGDDDGDTGRLLAEIQQPLALYLPLITR